MGPLGGKLAATRLQGAVLRRILLPTRLLAGRFHSFTWALTKGAFRFLPLLQAVVAGPAAK